MRVVIGIMVVMLLALVSYYLIQGETHPTRTGTPSATSTNLESTAAPEVVGEGRPWRSFEDGQLLDEWYFTIEYPAEMTVRSPRDDQHTFRYLGPASMPNTEITDGIYLVIETTLADTLEDYVSSLQPNGTPQRVTFNGTQAARFTSVTQLGTQPQHIAFVLDEQDEQVVVVDINYTLSGEQNARALYQRTVDHMLSTLSFAQSVRGGNADDRLRIDQPADGETIRSPLIVTGEARGTWYAEATFPVVVTDWDGRIIGEGYAEAQSDWMTEDYVPFRGTIEYEADPAAASSRGTVIFERANPSGLAANDAAIEIPVMLAEVQ